MKPFLLLPLRKDTLPQLDVDEIVAWSENNFDDFLCLIGSLAPIRNSVDEAEVPFAPHGLVTFGAVVQRHKGIIAHFPSIPPPEWFCHDQTAGIHASYSKQVPYRVDLSFHTPGEIKAAVVFVSRIPTRLSAAYLAQSLDFLSDPDDSQDLSKLFISAIWLAVMGTFLPDPTTHRIPVYLFVPPSPIDNINGVYCIRYSLLKGLFYWTLDPEGKNVIPEQDWEKYSVPRLQTSIWARSGWTEFQYDTVRYHLLAKNYPFDGKQYARDHGYPELIRGDPHDISFKADSFPPV